MNESVGSGVSRPPYGLLLSAFVLTAGCQRVVELEVDRAIAWIAVVELDEAGAVLSATGLLPADGPLPRQTDEGRGLLVGWSAEALAPYAEASERFSEPLSLADPCDAEMPPAGWAVSRAGREYRSLALEEAPVLTADWLGPRCPADRICRAGRCLEAVVEIDAGDRFACARWSSGRISCWGSSVEGTLGGDVGQSVEFVPEAVLVEDVEDAVRLTVGRTHACALREGGRAVCWGSDWQGQLRDGRGSDVPWLPRAIEGIENAKDVAAGARHTCAVVGSGRVACWGHDDVGQLGDGRTESDGLPVTVPGVEDAVQVVSGDAHTCVRRSGGRVTCWGSNARGQLGLPGASSPVEARALGVTALAAGSEHNCAIAEGEVTCWGRNDEGQTGGGAPQLSDRAVGLAAADTSCALLEGGALECWGASRYGELGLLGQAPFFSNLPVFAPALPEPTRAVAVGGEFVCALDAADAVWCWGWNAVGQLGNGASGIIEDRKVPLRQEVTALAAGGSMSCALAADGEVLCWGYNDLGQLGRGRFSLLEGPDRVALPGAAVDVDTGNTHACAVAEGGDVYCWGDNQYGQAAPEDDAIEVADPVRVLGSAVDVATGDLHTCAVLATGQVWCWGYNTDGGFGSGVLGRDEVGFTYLPAPIPGVSNAVKAAAGLFSTCLLLADRTVRCFGYPFDAAGMPPVEELGVGRGHACVRTEDGRVFCWGWGDHGQLGDGMKVNRGFAEPVVGIDDATRLIVGSSHNCVVRATGGLWCWGDNLTGQLGDGTWPDDRGIPGPVPGLEGVLLGDGFLHTCVLTDAGTVECWGFNPVGQVDFETAAIRIVPSRVVGLDPL